ncbi:MAG: hypothetical protein KVP17_001950 [Porospora cf. gigantea B]|nr:MAG: hypothetical protein KVP17_001950 [Porospora cf. gigantea B]
MSDEIQANLNKLQTTAKETFRSAESLRDDMNRLSGDQIRVDEDLSKVDAQVNDLRKQELNFQHTMERALGGEICQVPFLEYMNCVQHLKARLSALTVNVADARQAMDYLAQTNHEEEWDIRAGRSHSFDALVRQVVQTHSHQYYAVKKAFDSLHKELESLSQKKKTHERVLA